MAEYINKDTAMDAGTLYDWYISSIDETVPPVWTDEHIEELLEDFLVIPKDTPAADVRPERYGHWIPFGNNDVACSECNYAAPQNNIYISPKRYKYCPYCGAKMNEEHD